MLTLLDLWLPILLSAAAVWFWAFLSWAILPIHRRDHGPLPDEEALLRYLRELNLPPGAYGFPHAKDSAQHKDPAFVEKWKAGPTGMLNVLDPKAGMGMNMLLTFIVYLIVSLLIGYIGWAAGLPRGADFWSIFRVLGTAGILAYTFAFLPSMIWFQATPNAKLAGIMDGLISGVVTGLIFAALWPGVAVTV
jgi:hypothetical protein